MRKCNEKNRELWKCENYAEYLLLNGLKVGDKLRRNHGCGHMGDVLYTVTNITDTHIIAEFTKRFRGKGLNKGVVIEIDSCGSFPSYIRQ